EEALVPGSPTTGEEIVRLDLLEPEAPAEWRGAAAVPRTRKRGRVLVWVALGQVATDVATLFLALWIAGAAAPPAGRAGVLAALLAGAGVAWIGVFGLHGLYRPLHLPAHAEFRRIFGAASVASLIVATGAVAFGPPVSGAWPVWLWLAALGLELIGRGLWRVALDGSRRRGELR